MSPPMYLLVFRHPWYLDYYDHASPPVDGVEGEYRRNIVPTKSFIESSYFCHIYMQKGSSQLKLLHYYTLRDENEGMCRGGEGMTSATTGCLAGTK